MGAVVVVLALAGLGAVVSMGGVAGASVTVAVVLRVRAGMILPFWAYCGWRCWSWRYGARGYAVSCGWLVCP